MNKNYMTVGDVKVLDDLGTVELFNISGDALITVRIPSLKEPIAYQITKSDRWIIVGEGRANELVLAVCTGDKLYVGTILIGLPAFSPLRTMSVAIDELRDTVSYVIFLDTNDDTNIVEVTVDPESTEGYTGGFKQITHAVH